MTHDPTHDAEMDAVVAVLTEAGLVETPTILSVMVTPPSPGKSSTHKY